MKIHVIIFLIFGFYASSAAADDYDFEEGRTLLAIVEELDFLIGLTEEQSKKPRTSDFVFNYDQLGSDLVRIRQLIRYHMENAAKRPNHIKPMPEHADPVKGAYSTRKY